MPARFAGEESDERSHDQPTNGWRGDDDEIAREWAEARQPGERKEDEADGIDQPGKGEGGEAAEDANESREHHQYDGITRFGPVTGEGHLVHAGQERTKTRKLIRKARRPPLDRGRHIFTH